MPEADEQDTGQEAHDNPNIRQLREKAERASELERQVAAQARELAFVKAGIDTESKLGSLLFKSYEGDVSDIEALKKEATEIGAIRVEEPTGSESGASDEAPEPTGSDQRRDLASGAPADEQPQVDPYQEAQAKYDTAMGNGATWEVAAGEFFHSLGEAARRGDQRVILPQNGRRVQGQ